MEESDAQGSLFWSVFSVVTTQMTIFCDVALRIQKQGTSQSCISQTQTGIHHPPSQNKAASSCRLPCHFLNHCSSPTVMSCRRKKKNKNNGGPKRGAFASRWKTKRPFKGSNSETWRERRHYSDAGILNFHEIKLLRKLQANHKSSLVCSFILKLYFAFFCYIKVAGSPPSKVFERNPSWIQRFNSWKFCPDRSVQAASIAAWQRVISKRPWQWHQTPSKIFLFWVQSLSAASGCRDSLAV